NALDLRAREIGTNVERILEQNTLVAELHRKLHEAHEVREADRAQIRSIFSEVSAMRRAADRLTEQVETYHRSLAQRDAELTALKSAFTAGVHTVEQRAAEMKALIGAGLRETAEAHREQQDRTTVKL